MGLPNDLIMQFVKATNDSTRNTNEERIVFGTVVEHNGIKYMRIDGSNMLTPISSTTDVENGERVTASMKNHSLIVTGNLSSPAARTDDVDKVAGDLSDAKVLVDFANSQLEEVFKNINDLGQYTDYIKFGIDDGKPCIILGETDNAFKLLITNKDIRFMEGSVVPASISGQALNIETAVVNGEIRQGDFAWGVRPNGHYSLMWNGKSEPGFEFEEG